MNRKLKAKIIENFGSQFEFSRAMGIHECDVSRIVRNRRELSIEDRRKWASVLKTKPNKIFGERN